MKRLQKFRHFKRRPLSDINVTPFIDVMLVLLVIFMVTAPILTVGVKIDLPQANAPALDNKEEPLSIVITGTGEIFLNSAQGDTQLDLATLGPKLVAITNANPEARIYIHGSQQLLYGRVLEVMSVINRAGFRRIALIAETPKKKTASRVEDKR